MVAEPSEPDDAVEKKIPRSLWDQAYEDLAGEDKKALETAGNESQPRLEAVRDIVEEKKKDCEAKQWVLYTNDAGERVTVRDRLNRVSEWLEKFIKVGDVAIQYDPAQAALPWAAVRTLLQVSTHATIGGINLTPCSLLSTTVKRLGA